GRDLYADERGRLAGGDGRHPGLLRRRRRATTHHLPGGDAGIWQGEVPGAPGVGDRTGQGEVPRGPLRGDRRRGERELGVPPATHRGAGDRLLACGGVPGEGGGGAASGPPPNEGGVAGGGVPSVEARRGWGRMGAEAVAATGPGAALGEGPRGGAAGDHLL